MSRTYNRFVIMGLIGAFIVAGCSERPIQEINETTALVEALVPNENALKYAKEEAAELDKGMKAALYEIKTQDKKIFKNYNKAREMLASLLTDAEHVADIISQRKEQEQKDSITAAQNGARDAVEAVNAQLQASTDKMKKADIEILKTDLKDLENMLADSPPDNGLPISSLQAINLINNAMVVKKRASSISRQIDELIQK